MANLAFGYPYKLERQKNGWWLVRFPDVPEALTEGETKEEAFENAQDCLITALEGYVKAGRAIPRPPFKGRSNCAAFIGHGQTRSLREHAKTWLDAVATCE